MTLVHPEHDNIEVLPVALAHVSHTPRRFMDKLECSEQVMCPRNGGELAHAQCQRVWDDLEKEVEAGVVETRVSSRVVFCPSHAGRLGAIGNIRTRGSLLLKQTSIKEVEKQVGKGQRPGCTSKMSR